MFSLKLCCVLVVIIASTYASLTPEQIEAFQTVVNDCKGKTGATDDDVAAIRKHEVPQTKTGLCLASCIKKTLGLLKEDNTLNVMKIEELLAPLKAEDADTYKELIKIVNTCAVPEAVEADECLAAKNVLQCLKEKVEASQLKLDFSTMLS